MGGGESKPSMKGAGTAAPSIMTYDVTYIGDMKLPEDYSPGLETVRYALPLIKEECKDITAKVSLAISVYGIKAMRTSFAGLKQEEYMETADGAVSFDFVCNESIYRVAFGADVGRDFCVISQDKEDLSFRCYAFQCKSRKQASLIADATALACQRVFNTLALLKAKLKTIEQANKEVDQAQRPSMVKLKDQNKKMLVELIHHEGFADADEKFKSEMLMLAGMPDKGGAHAGYIEPTGDYTGPSKRTQIRQADPNEYERTRF